MVRATTGSGVLRFFVLACVITWLLDLPIALAMLDGTPPSPAAMALGGLGALGPTIAAFVIAAPRRELREVFGRWRVHPGWLVLAIFVIPALHLPATILEVALGGTPAQWFYPPAAPEHVAALVMFSVGEELGWRGFAYPRLERSHGPVVASVIVGAVWTVWHLMMWVTPEGAPSIGMVASALVELTAASVVFAWVFERADRSLSVAIALHMGAHLDNVHRAPDTEVRLHALRLCVLVVAAVLAGRSLSRAAARRGAVP